VSPLDELEVLAAKNDVVDWDFGELVGLGTALPTLLRLARVAIETLSAAGPLTFTPPGKDYSCCLFCGAPVNSGVCCLDPMREVLRELTQERSPA
jgi:hypothetical protein